MSDASRRVFVDGAPASSVSPWELGLMLGHGAFETMRTVNGEIVAIGPHMLRLGQSLKRLGLELDIRAVTLDVLRLPRLIEGESLVRAIVAAREGGGTTRVVLAEPWTFGPAPPVAAATVELTRPVADAKLTGFGVSWVALAQARARGASEALLVRDGFVTEGATSNVFVTDGERLVTAPDDGGILSGVTRSIVLSLARSLGLDVAFEHPRVELLARAGGFITSTKRGVVALGELDGATLPVSPLTTLLSDSYRAELKAFCGCLDAIT